MKEPLAMPKGSVRAILAIGLIAGVIAGFMLDKIGADQFIQLATIALTFYFVVRSTGAR